MRLQVFPPDIALCWRADLHVCLCRSRERHRHRNADWGQTHEHLWARLRNRGIKIHVAAIGVTPEADKRARAVLDGWALDRDGIRAGDYREAGLREELDALSRGIDTVDSRIFARYWGQPNTVRRWRELKDMLATPLPYNIRIDTFEIWRSRRIYPAGVDLYEIPE